MFTDRKLPIGIQDFEKLRTENYVYVDKTAYMHQLTQMSWPYFLGRPRRFGKSLLISTLKAYFLGKKELFDGLAIAALEKDWVEYPVVHLDMNKAVYKNPQAFERSLHVLLGECEAAWGIENRLEDASLRFDRLISEARRQAGCKVVVLVDEYDKPLVNTLDDPELNSSLRETLKNFYGILKSADANLRFVMLTGVTKFSKVSVFSDLNHLVDVSMDKEYADICGISESELVAHFQPEITAFADELGKSYEETLAELKKRYDGYHFAKDGEWLYNPFSLLNTFAKKEFNSYWFATGTPTFLVKMLKNIDFDIKNLEGDVRIPATSITDYKIGDVNPLSLLYQSGYLTIKSYEALLDEYVLGFPNEEVKYGFFNELLPAYVPDKDVRSEFYVTHFIRDLLAHDVDGFMTRLRAFFAGIPYELNSKGEKHYQTIFFILFRLMGQLVEAEQRSAVGRADAVVVTADTVFVFEFKLTGNATAEEALKQIDDKGYLIPYSAGGKALVKVGA
ncbi:MAG: ATP-binding protein, partial [Prevotellaceae bacterium]|nr:ATP-binding protein [Prevotellaceae bacterium]